MRPDILGLKSHPDNAAVALQSVQAHGQLQGLVLRMKLRQVYRNTTTENLECVYTFPLAWGSVLLSMTAELNGRRMTSRVVEKPTAEITCPKAMPSGNRPVMLQRSGKDLYSAHLGNLLPGDEAWVEVEYAQLLRIEGGMLRLNLPGTMAPCQGHALARGGLAALQTAAASVLDEDRLHVSLDVGKPLADGVITSPSHEVQRVNHQAGVTVKFLGKASLYRDLVLNIHGLKDMGFAMASADAAHAGRFTLLSSSVVHWDERALGPARLRLKVLVDSSGSMQGDGMEQARSALDWLFHQLQSDDEVSMSRFGSQTLHVLPRLQRCTEAYQRRLRAEARNIQADLGGKDLATALQSVIGIPTEDDRRLEAASILLITSGALMAFENTVAMVRQSGHRVFALGVGSAPAERGLRELAEVSGGACELISPRQNRQQAVARLLDRLRRSCAIGCQLLSDTPVMFQSPAPREVSQGDTLHLWAQTGVRPVNPPRLQWTLAGVHPATHSRQAAQLVWDEHGVLTRLCAAQRLLDTRDEAAQRDLALQYQLVTPHTQVILVPECAESDKASDGTAWQQMPPMQAAARVDNMNNAGGGSMEIPEFLRQSEQAAATPPASKQPAPEAPPVEPVTPASEVPHVGPGKIMPASAGECGRQQRKKNISDPFRPLTRVLQSLDDPANPLALMVQAFNAQAGGNQTLRSALSLTLRTARTGFMAEFILFHAKALGSPAMVWAVLLVWLSDTKGLPLERHALGLLCSELQGLDEALRTKVRQSLESACQLAG